MLSNICRHTYLSNCFFVIYSDVITNYIYYNFLNNLYSQIESQITNNTSDFIPVLIQFAILISVQVVSFVLSSVFGYFYYQIKIPRFIEKMKDIIYHKSRTVEISKYENPDFYDDFVWSFEYAVQGCKSYNGNARSNCIACDDRRCNRFA